jgi:hypothetical protein
MDFDTGALSRIFRIVTALWRQKWSSLFATATELLPQELRGARLIYAECLFRSQSPVVITARVDRVYRNAKGKLVLVELKTREANRTYWSDVIELSAQRFALGGQTGEAMADHAYILTERPDGHPTGFHRVRLMVPADLIALAMRRQELLAGKTDPEQADFRGVCRKCAFVRPCNLPWPQFG